MEYPVKQLQLVLLHYGYMWLTAAGSSGLLWNTVKVVQPDLVVPNGRVGFKQLVFGIFVDVT
jgi:hypothetical protein